MEDDAEDEEIEIERIDSGRPFADCHGATSVTLLPTTHDDSTKVRPAEQNRPILSVLSRFCAHPSRVVTPSFRLISSMVQCCKGRHGNTLAGSTCIVSWTELNDHRSDTVTRALDHERTRHSTNANWLDIRLVERASLLGKNGRLVRRDPTMLRNRSEERRVGKECPV